MLSDVEAYSMLCILQAKRMTVCQRSLVVLINHRMVESPIHLQVFMVIETLRWDNENGNCNLIRHETAVDVAVAVVLSLVITIFAKKRENLK